MGKVSDDLNENCSALAITGFEAKRVVRECLIPFPYIWASIDKVLIDDTCLTMLCPIPSW